MLDVQHRRRTADRECADGALGEVLFYGPTVTPGYWNRPDATAETVRDGWLHTGDIGYLDDEGLPFIVDRAKDMIIRGGENVYCVEIENCWPSIPRSTRRRSSACPTPRWASA